MGEKLITELNDNGARRNADDRVTTVTPEAPRDAAHPYVDPAQAVMESNPNLSPPIHPNP